MHNYISSDGNASGVFKQKGFRGHKEHKSGLLCLKLGLAVFTYLMILLEKLPGVKATLNNAREFRMILMTQHVEICSHADFPSTLLKHVYERNI